MARKLAPCGTPAAYRRHKRHGEPVDEACQAAVRALESERRRAAGGNGEDKGAVLQLHPGLASGVSVEVRALARERLEASLVRLEMAMDAVVVAEPMQIVTLSRRHSEVIAELLALDAPAHSSPEAGEGDPFEQFFGAGGASRRPAAAPRT